MKLTRQSLPHRTLLRRLETIGPKFLQPRLRLRQRQTLAFTLNLCKDIFYRQLMPRPDIGCLFIRFILLLIRHRDLPAD